ncbi:MAG: hypothetical protein INR64_16455 [Caulobacteraceae bacterium]|nr:hypothetical protein [Caulobacter sp.]
MTAAPLVAILTPDPAEPSYARRWRASFDRYARALAAAGARVRPIPWTEAPAPDADLHLGLLAWGYHLAPNLWRDRLTSWPASARLLNSPAVLGWNTDKRYLLELERAGVATVPTRFVGVADAAAVAEAVAAFDTDDLVVKPQVSAGAHATARLRARDANGAGAGGPIGPAMLQPFLPAVQAEGELSLLVFGGTPAYAVAKRAAAGDFRVQVQHGGLYATTPITEEMRVLAASALAACPQAPAYARVDMVRDAHGDLRLMELELIEPDLYLDHAPDGGAAFAAAVMAALTAP